MAVLNAVCAVAEDSICQSCVPPFSTMFQLNQTIALILGMLSGSWVDSASVIQAALEPPTSVEPISPIMIGLLGARPSSASYVGFMTVEKLFQTSRLNGRVPKLYPSAHVQST